MDIAEIERGIIFVEVSLINMISKINTAQKGKKLCVKKIKNDIFDKLSFGPYIDRKKGN